jgi:glycosyltransferase involved in cell wall biosynthesis
VESVSFVVIAFNEEANIASTISSITELDGLAEYEIIVVNDGSSDRTTEIVSDIAASNANVKQIARPNKMGRGNARKTGVEASSGELIATVDADIILPRDWLVRAREALTDFDAVGGTGVPDGDVAYIHRRFRLVPRLVGQATTVTGGNALYRRSVFDVVQFDSNLDNGEDCALNYEMDAAGLLCETVPGLVVEHRENKSFRTSVQWLFESGIGATRQFRTYREIRQPDIVTAGFVSALGVGISVAALTRQPAVLAVPVCFVAAASVQHVRTRFKVGLADLPRALPATAVDAVLLTSYFAGRLAGVGRRLPTQTAPRATARAAARTRR